ncbi:MAG TPA: hypothetical protein VN605_13220 [Thermoanaerobaculia bacterium]|nr:hypothetical protein [Thermoanaerobaculia bacterium]
MKKAFILATAVFSFALVASAQDEGTIGYSPVTCIRASEMPVLQVNLSQPGTLRAFFRRVNTTDWCSVEGKNEGPLSSVTLPKFEANDEIEYYFLLVNGKRVMAKSPQIYRVKVGNSCETPFARHILMLTMDCSTNGPGSMPASMGAGVALQSNVVPPAVPSPGSRVQ